MRDEGRLYRYHFDGGDDSDPNSDHSCSDNQKDRTSPGLTRKEMKLCDGSRDEGSNLEELYNAKGGMGKEKDGVSGDCLVAKSLSLDPSNSEDFKPDPLLTRSCWDVRPEKSGPDSITDPPPPFTAAEIQPETTTADRGTGDEASTAFPMIQLTNGIYQDFDMGSDKEGVVNQMEGNGARDRGIDSLKARLSSLMKRMDFVIYRNLPVVRLPECMEWDFKIENHVEDRSHRLIAVSMCGEVFQCSVLTEQILVYDVDGTPVYGWNCSFYVPLTERDTSPPFLRWLCRLLKKKSAICKWKYDCRRTVYLMLFDSNKKRAIVKNYSPQETMYRMLYEILKRQNPDQRGSDDETIMIAWGAGLMTRSIPHPSLVSVSELNQTRITGPESDTDMNWDTGSSDASIDSEDSNVDPHTCHDSMFVTEAIGMSKVEKESDILSSPATVSQESVFEIYDGNILTYSNEDGDEDGSAELARVQAEVDDCRVVVRRVARNLQTIVKLFKRERVELFCDAAHLESNNDTTGFFEPRCLPFSRIGKLLVGNQYKLSLAQGQAHLSDSKCGLVTVHRVLPNVENTRRVYMQKFEIEIDHCESNVISKRIQEPSCTPVKFLSGVDFLADGVDCPMVKSHLFFLRLRAAALFVLCHCYLVRRFRISFRIEYVTPNITRNHCELDCKKVTIPQVIDSAPEISDTESEDASEDDADTDSDSDFGHSEVTDVGKATEIDQSSLSSPAACNEESVYPLISDSRTPTEIGNLVNRHMHGHSKKNDEENQDSNEENNRKNKYATNGSSEDSEEPTEAEVPGSDGSRAPRGVALETDVNSLPVSAAEHVQWRAMSAKGGKEAGFELTCGLPKLVETSAPMPPPLKTNEYPHEYQYSGRKSPHTNLSTSLTYPSLPGTYQSLSGNYQSLPGEPTLSQSFREPISHQLSSLTLRDSGYDVTTTRSDVTKDESGLAPLPEPDYRRERDRLASFWQAPRKAEVDPIICAREGLWCTGWQDCAACFQCPFRHWDWRLGQDPKKLHLDNSPNCPVAKGESDVNEPFEPSMLTLSRDGKDKVTACMQALLPKQMELEQYNEDAEKRRDEEKKMLTRAAIEDSVAVNYRLSKAPLGESTYEIPETPNPPLPDPIPGAPTKIIYYALEHSREGQPRCVPHIVDPKATVAQKSGVPDELRNEKHRLDSFRKWPGTPPFIVYDYARNGFFYTGTNRDIKCAFCGGVLAVPGILRRFSITAKHKRAFPTCPLVLKLEVGNVQLPVDEKLKLPTQNTEAHTLRQPDWTGIEQAILTIKFPQFADRNNRALSFMGWSPDFNQKSDLLVECGFFCLGDGDSVRCFHCGGGLRNWEPTDDPWREHARWFPRCMYLQQKKGLDYVRRVRDESNVTDWVATAGGSGASGSGSQSSGGRKRRLNLTQGAIPSPIPNTPRFPNGVTEPSVMSRGVQWRFQPREIRARMDTTGVRRLMDMGYSPVVIRFCIVTQLRDTGKDFQRLDELTEAVLDLEPVVEEHGEHFLEVILKNKYDLDHLPALLKESYYQTVDETYVPELRITPPSTRPDVSTTRPDVTATRDVTSTTRTNGSGSATTTTSSAAPQTLTTTDGGDRRQAQAQRLESNIARVAAAGSSAPSQPPAPQTEPEPPSQGRRGRKSRKKSSDPRGSDTATPSTSSAATHDDPGSASSSLSAASELAEENARLREQNLCKICLDRPINIAFIPCGHLAVCFECGRTLTECPICRKNIRKRQRIFLS